MCAAEEPQSAIVVWNLTVSTASIILLLRIASVAAHKSVAIQFGPGDEGHIEGKCLSEASDGRIIKK
jgi:hypothetical protein